MVFEYASVGLYMLLTLREWMGDLMEIGPKSIEGLLMKPNADFEAV